jgi:hypothetical protein
MELGRPAGHQPADTLAGATIHNYFLIAEIWAVKD